MDKIDELLNRGVDKIYPSKEALEKILRAGKKLRLYQGFDPTGPLLHIGHLVGLMKLRQFQKLGHHVIFLIGDFTGMIGDPTGKSGSRKPMTREDVLKNAEFYKEQTSKILDFTGVNPVEIKYNSKWLAGMKVPEIIRLFSYLTYQQIIERDMFQERKKKGLDIALPEFFYPVLQGYDSVCMDVDLEIGGSDQLFNMMVGRELMRKIKRKEKFVMTTPLLTDSRGVKIGKTEGNVIALTAAPHDLYGMIMNLPDEVIGPCFERLTDLPLSEVREVEETLKKDTNPMILKKKLAHKLTEMLNDTQAADTAESYFEQTFQKKELPKNIPSFAPSARKLNVLTLIKETGLVSSATVARQLITDGAVEINGKKVTDINQQLSIPQGTSIKIGKHKYIKTA